MPNTELEEIYRTLPDEEQSYVAGLFALLDGEKGFQSKLFMIRLLADDVLSNSYEATQSGGYKDLVLHMQGLVKGNKK